MTATTSTLSDIKGDLETWLSISVPENIVILAYNDFANRIYKFEEENFPSRERKTSGIVSVGTSGVDLSSVITDARDFDIGFEAYRVDSNGTLDLSKKYKRVHPANRDPSGYYIDQGVFKLSFPSQVNVKFVYNKARTVVSRDADIKAITFPWDADLEEAFREFLGMKYFQSEQLPGNSNDANLMAQQAIMSYYSQMQSS